MIHTITIDHFICTEKGRPSCFIGRVIEFSVGGDLFRVEIPDCCLDRRRIFGYHPISFAESAEWVMEAFPHVRLCSHKDWKSGWQNYLYPHVDGFDPAKRKYVDRWEGKTVFACRGINSFYVDINATVAAIGKPFACDCGKTAFSKDFHGWNEQWGKFACSRKCLKNLIFICKECEAGFFEGRKSQYSGKYGYCSSECHAIGAGRERQKMIADRKNQERFLINAAKTSKALELHYGR